MNQRNNLYKKKWTSDHNKSYLFSYYNGAAKAKPSREFRKLCAIHGIRMWFLPSAFRIESLFYAQGPSVGGVTSGNINYQMHKSLIQTKSLTMFEKNRAFPARFFKILNNTTKAQDLCLNLCFSFDSITQK